MQGKQTGKKGGNNTGEEEIQPPKEWTKEEEQALRDAHEVFGESWDAILKSKRFKAIFAGRVEYMLRNKWRYMKAQDAMEKAVLSVSPYNLFNLLKDVNCTLADTVVGLKSANQKLDAMVEILKK